MTRAPWLAEMPLAWSPVFPSEARKGYDSPQTELEDWLRLLPTRDSWEIESPTLLLIWNPARRDDRRIISRLEDDTRFRAAALLFKCLRLDARSLTPPPKEPVVAAFDTRGRLIGTLRGPRLQRTFNLLRRAQSASEKPDLRQLLPALHATVGELARQRARVRKLETSLVCPDCGALHDATARALAASREQVARLERRLADLRSGV
jgi:hypothetical protein